MAANGDYTYTAPPISEVGLSVATILPSIFDAYDIQEVHSLFRDRFPNVARQQPFNGMDPFPGPHSPIDSAPTINIGPIPFHNRWWFISEDDAAVVQLQENFVARNWRRTTLPGTQGAPYPGFDTLIADFKSQIKTLSDWHSKYRRELPEPQCCELLYDNMIPLENEDGTRLKREDIIEILKPDVRKKSGFNWNWLEAIDGDDGDLNFMVSIRSLAVQAAGVPDFKTAKPFIKLTFTARANNGSWDEVYAFFDRAHSHIRLRLHELVTQKCRDSWKV